MVIIIRFRRITSGEQERYGTILAGTSKRSGWCKSEAQAVDDILDSAFSFSSSSLGGVVLESNAALILLANTGKPSKK